MKLAKYKSILTVLIALFISLYSGLAAGDVTFTEKTETHTVNTTNPVNEVGFGSIIYYLPSSDHLTQVALDTRVQMDITGTINRVRVEQTFTNPSNEWVEGVYVCLRRACNNNSKRVI